MADVLDSIGSAASGMADSLGTMWNKFMHNWHDMWDSHGQTLSSGPASEYGELGRFLSKMVRDTPQHLDQAFSMRHQLNAPDTMTGISNTAVTGAHGAFGVNAMLKKLAGSSPASNESDQ